MEDFYQKSSGIMRIMIFDGVEVRLHLGFE
jgi:hypothetical protein